MHYRMTPGKHGLGWIPDVPDQRDFIYKPSAAPKAVQLPQAVDLRVGCPTVYDQGQLGSCTANAIGAAFDFDRHKQGKDFMMPSRLFIYYNERAMEGTVSTDAGANIRDGIKSIAKQGVPPEKEWPYDIIKFADKPSTKSYTDAEKNQALQYQRILRAAANPTFNMLTCLSEGYPFVSGISVYASFETPETAKTGIVPMPTADEELLGGHAILVVGYQQNHGRFICRNSWGAGWGDKGYFYLPFSYLASARLASDMWVVKTVEV